MRSMEWRSTLSADLFPDPGAPASGMRAGGSIVSEGAVCQLRDLGRIGFTEAYVLQQDFVARRKRGEIPDQFLIVEHPHVVTMGRNGRPENLLAPPELLARAGIAFHHTDRGGDVTYHGPGQIVGYPIFDLREWKRDVVAYVRGLEQVVIDALAGFGIEALRNKVLFYLSTSPSQFAEVVEHLHKANLLRREETANCWRRIGNSYVMGRD